MRKWKGCIMLAAVLLSLGAAGAVGAREIVRFGGDVVVEEDMRVEKAVAIGGDVTVDGVVEEDAVAIGGSVRLGPTAVVEGDAVSIGGNVESAVGAEIHGDVVEIGLPGVSWAIGPISRGRWGGLFWGLRSMVFIGFLAVALLIVSILPKPVGMISTTVEEHFLKAILWGVLGIVLIGPATILLAVSIVGIVLIPFELLAIACALVVGYVTVARLVGKRMMDALRKPDQPMFWETLLGVVLLWVVGWVPVLGWLVKGVAWLLGLGGVIVTLLDLRKRPQEGLQSR